MIHVSRAAFLKHSSYREKEISMWQLLKAEFSYYRYNLYFSVIAYILFICGYIVCLVVDSGFIRYHHIIIAS